MAQAGVKNIGLPSGTVTFLFTDIESSTQTIEAMGAEAYADALETHRELLRDAFKSRGGHEVGTEGDAFFVAFPRAADAVAAAVEAQKALNHHPLRVRMGMHTGEALVRSGDYVGHDVHKAKRICDAGHGGQVLVSQTTADIVGSAVELLDLGSHRLKDLGDAERLHQVVADGIQSSFPPPRSIESFTHNLPRQRTSFIGREREITEIRELLREHRLVTLTGVGGCGKTRLAVQLGAEALDEYPDGVFFVDLARINDPALVAGTVAEDIGIRTAERSGGAAANVVAAYLSGRRTLLILDNCEHLVEPCAEFVDELLDRGEGVTVLATSREALDVPGEQTWPIPSLSLPKGEDDLASSEAVALFVARAKAVRPDFELSSETATAVAEIVRRLDGIPLAVEFAAARVAYLSPHEIAERLGDMFRLLTGGRRRVQRQQTLQAALDWSYELLTQPEQILLRRLGVFAGAFTAQAAEGVCSDEDLERGTITDLIGSLVLKSLVTKTDYEGRARYRLIEPVRAYASEKLREADEAELFRSRHRDWCQEWLESFSWEQIFLSQSIGLTIADELPNLRAALEWSEGERRPDLFARMACRMNTAWSGAVGGGARHREEISRLIEWIDPHDLGVSNEVRVAFLHLVAQAADGPSEILMALDRAVEAAGGVPSSPLIDVLVARAWLRSVRAVAYDPSFADLAREDITEAERIAQEVGVLDAWKGWILMLSGVVEMMVGNVELGAEHLRRGAELDSDLYVGGHQDLMAAAHAAGDHRLAQWSLEQWSEGSRRWERRARVFGSWITTPAVVVAQSGDVATALTMLNEHLDEVRQLRTGLDEILIGFAAVACMTGDAMRASKILWWVRQRETQEETFVSSAMAWVLYRHYVGVIRDALSEDDRQRARVEGRAMSEEDVVTLVHGIRLPGDEP